MKLKKIIYAFPLAVFLIVVGMGCRKSKFNINQEPNNPTDSTVTYDVILPAAQHGTGTILATQWGTIQNWMGYWARSGTYAPNVIEETYQITTSFGTGVWNSAYDNAYDYQVIINKAERANAKYYEGVARIMKSHDFMILVDTYGNVPYTEALQGNNNPTPTYENGVDIYKALFRDIDLGMEQIRGSDEALNPDIETNDIMFHGDTTLWFKFANTLKLKMLVHAYAVPGIDKAAEFAIIEAWQPGNTDIYLGAEEDAQVQPGYKVDKPNPFFDLYKSDVTGAQTANNVYYRANAFAMSYYAADGDPRITRLYEAGSGGLKGVEYGLPPITANASTVLAGIGPGLYKSSTAPQAILTASESLLLQAEAQERSFITTAFTTQQLIEMGIQESFRYLGIDDPAGALADYLDFNAGFPDVDYNAGPVVAGGPSGGLFTILSQKWFALNGIDPLEVWTDYRRVPYTEVATSTGAPSDHFVYAEGAGGPTGPPISVAPQNTSSKIPVRYLYPQTEYNYNAENVGNQGSIDPFTSKVFWDVN